MPARGMRSSRFVKVIGVTPLLVVVTLLQLLRHSHPWALDPSRLYSRLESLDGCSGQITFPAVSGYNSSALPHRAGWYEAHPVGGDIPPLCFLHRPPQSQVQCDKNLFQVQMYLSSIGLEKEHFDREISFQIVDWQQQQTFTYCKNL